MLTIQFVPHHEIASMSSVGRIRKLLNLAKDNKIVILEGRLKKEEETELIKATMEEINSEFKGIEMAVLDSTKGSGIGFKRMLADFLLKEKRGTTIIGPATVVKEIRQDPNRIQLLIKDKSDKKKSKNRNKK
ncbi:MAG TPA: DUF2073 domain-containing protein [Candidatus Nanoarchaeia archaeon]|nr:DUF2073 domain-containing protein [Candidatus Nanoarchaeia archaeon]